jgi:hypothetical protein
MILADVLGVVGLISICVGVLLKKRKRDDIFYIIGGILLEIYSIIMHDAIFIILQIVFVASALYDLSRK